MAPAFNFSWEILGGASAVVHDEGGFDGCGVSPDDFDGFSEVFVGGAIIGTVCVPIPLEDLTDPATQVATYHPADKPAIGGGMLFLNSARVVMNTIFSGVFDRFPDLQMVAVESGIGWIPFMLETMDYELIENAPQQYGEMSKKPSEYFASNWHATFWFEHNRGHLQHLMDQVGDDRILFETDFPHPTCLYPAPLDEVAEKMNALRPETRRRVMGENAARLYRL